MTMNSKTPVEQPCLVLPSEYIPESWSMLKDSIYAATDAIRAGIENTQEPLVRHDIDLGRTTRSNRYTAERLELEIAQMQKALEGLSKPNGQAFGADSPMAQNGVRRLVDIGGPDMSSWSCDCTDSNIRRVDGKHPHPAIDREGWFCMGCLSEFVRQNSGILPHVANITRATVKPK